MKLRMVVAVMALLAAGCGAEQWSTSTQVATVNGCVESFQAMAARDADGSVARDMEEAGVTTHDVCRCALEELEERYSESDFLTLSPTEQHESTVEAVGKCGEELFAL